MQSDKPTECETTGWKKSGFFCNWMQNNLFALVAVSQLLWERIFHLYSGCSVKLGEEPEVLVPVDFMKHPCQFITVMQTWIFKSVFIYREVAEAVFIPGGGPHLAMEIHVLLHPMTYWLLVSLKTIVQEQHTSFCDFPCLSHQSQCLWSWQNTVL